MTTVPTLITDLALILMVAGLTTLIFRKLNQPLVLGYIVAGVIVGPVVSFFPTVADTENIHTLADIGVIFLMFSLGLDFSIHKLLKMGKTAFVTAGFSIGIMILLGYGIGMSLNWGRMNSLFLGGMICMSSTIIILKAFDDLKLKGEKYTQNVLGVLIIEDIAAVFLMVVLSTISISKGGSASVFFTLGKMALYLALWLILGYFVIPSAYRHMQKLFNKETLLVFSLGICFAMVWLANAIGFSSALGAFLAGSLMAGTAYSERIEKIISPCKDLFGAVFFVSVGMMVDPAMLVKYALPILIITLATMFGQIISISVGMLLSGKDFHTALSGGFCMCQIGEFSFIIASLGLSLHVTEHFLYPVVVAVSVITTFITPYWMKGARKCEKLLRKLLPNTLIELFDSPSEEKHSNHDPDWAMFFKRYLKSFFVYGVIIYGISLLGEYGFQPLLNHITEDSNLCAVLSTFLSLLLIAPFIRPFIKVKNRFFTSLFMKESRNRLPLSLLAILRLGGAVALLTIPLANVFEMPYLGLFLMAILYCGICARSDRLEGIYFLIEDRFLSNYNEKRLRELAAADSGSATRYWMDGHLFISQFLCGKDSTVQDKFFLDINWNSVLHVSVVKIIRENGTHINVPGGKQRITVGDRLFVMGEKKQLENFRDTVVSLGQLTDDDSGIINLSEFLDQQESYMEDDRLLCGALQVAQASYFKGKSIRRSGIKSKWGCALIGIEKGVYPMPHPNPNRLLFAGDILWVLGSLENLRQLEAGHLVNNITDKSLYEAARMERIRHRRSPHLGGRREPHNNRKQSDGKKDK